MAFGRELIMLHRMPSMFGKFFWCMLGGKCAGLNEGNPIFSSLRVELHLGMPRGAKMRLAFNELK